MKQKQTRLRNEEINDQDEKSGIHSLNPLISMFNQLERFAEKDLAVMHDQYLQEILNHK